MEITYPLCIYTLIVVNMFFLYYIFLWIFSLVCVCKFDQKQKRTKKKLKSSFSDFQFFLFSTFCSFILCNLKLSFVGWLGLGVGILREGGANGVSLALCFKWDNAIFLLSTILNTLVSMYIPFLAVNFNWNILTFMRFVFQACLFDFIF